MFHESHTNQASSAKNTSAIEKCPTVVGIGGQICSLNTYGVCGRGHVCSPMSPKEEPRRQPSIIRSRRPSNVPLDSGVRYRTWKCVGGLRPRERTSYGRSPVVRRTRRQGTSVGYVPTTKKNLLLEARRSVTTLTSVLRSSRLSATGLSYGRRRQWDDMLPLPQKQDAGKKTKDKTLMCRLPY